jgi:hypothetical protein
LISICSTPRSLAAKSPNASTAAAERTDIGLERCTPRPEDRPKTRSVDHPLDILLVERRQEELDTAESLQRKRHPNRA